MINRDHNRRRVKKEENLAGDAKGKLLTTGSERKIEEDQRANLVRLRDERESQQDRVVGERAGGIIPRA